MEVRRAADAILRLQASPLAPLLTPPSTARGCSRAQLSYKRSSNGSFRRSIYTTSIRNALKPSVTTSAAPLQAPKSEEPSSTTPQANPNSPSSIFSSPTNTSSRRNNSLDDISSALGWATPKARQPPIGSGVSSLLFPSRPSAQETTPAIGILSSIASKPPSYTQTRTPMDMSKMLGTSNPSARNGRPTSILDTYANMPASKPPPRPPINLNPSTGRSIMVGPGRKIDLATGLMMVNVSCTRNAVKRDATKQRFHERPGLKRKRLTRQRYRKRFMEGFKATCRKVREMSKMGW